MSTGTGMTLAGNGSECQASRRDREGLGMEVAGVCHKAAGTLTWGGGGPCMALRFGQRMEIILT